MVLHRELPHITVKFRIATGAHAQQFGSCAVLRGPTPELDVVYVDILGGGSSWRNRRSGTL